jgi:hypothetical protein
MQREKLLNDNIGHKNQLDQFKHLLQEKKKENELLDMK